MDVIKKLTEGELKEYTEIVANAYPGLWFNMPEEKQQLKERFIKVQREDDTINFYGFYRNNVLLGGMRLNDFKMRLGSVKVEAGGLGMVAVHLLHKKEKVAKEIVTFFLRHYRNRRVPIAMLYPFNPEFYKRMGFGFGTKMNQYSIEPHNLPKGGAKELVSFAEEEDKQLMLDCYGRIAERTNGILDRSEAELDGIMTASQNLTVVCKTGGRVEGYIVFTFKRVSQDNVLKNDVIIKEFLYENPEALKALFAFLHTQEDQINRIVFNTLDEDFHHILMYPGDGSDILITPVYHQSNRQGVGVMYRITDIRMLFDGLKKHNFNNQSCKLRLSIKDSFIKENSGSFVVHFTEGSAKLADNGEYDVSVELDIADFSSLAVGAVGFKALLRYGLAQISDPGYTDTIDKIFEMPGKPICLTAF